MGVCVYEACGFVCGVGELLGWYPQAFLTEEEKARGVKGAWLIVEALGEELDVKLQNLANLCEHWGWGLDFGSVNT